MGARRESARWGLPLVDPSHPPSLGMTYGIRWTDTIVTCGTLAELVVECGEGVRKFANAECRPSMGNTDRQGRVTNKSAPWVRIVIFAAVVAVLLAAAPPAYAGPGGQFVKVLFKSKAGAIFLGVVFVVLFVILLPLVSYVVIRERMGIRRTKRDLLKLAETYPEFDWTKLRKRIYGVVKKVHSAWDLENLGSVQELMEATYFRTQQQTLSRWAAEGNRNVCRLRKISRVEPLAVSVETAQMHAWVRALVAVDVRDYLENTATGEILRGSTEEQTGHESIWCFLFDGQKWVLCAIEESVDSLSWANRPNQINTTYADLVRTRVEDRASSLVETGATQSASKLSAKQSRQRDLPGEVKESFPNESDRHND